MLKGKLSHSKIVSDVCSCGTSTNCSSALSLHNTRLASKITRQYTVQDKLRKQEITKPSAKPFWKEQSKQRKFFDDLAKQIGIQTTDDWYQQLSKKVLIQNGGRGLLAVHNNSPITALMATYPERNWAPWKFNKVHQGYWSSVDNQKKFFGYLGTQLGIQTLDDWYQNLSKEVITKNGGAGLLAKYNGSPIVALMTVYPEHNWEPWKFNQVYQGYWNDAKNQRKFFDELGHQLGIEKLDDWYQKISQQVIVEHGASGLLAHHKESPTSALMAAYPEHNWMPWKFRQVSSGYWTHKENQKKFFDDLGLKLGVQKPDDWYQKLSAKAITEHGGAGLLSHYKHSPSAALMAVYPEVEWAPWKFNQVSAGYWNNVQNQKKFFDDLGLKLGVEKLDDWYQKVSHEVIKENGGSSLLTRHKESPTIALKATYPEHNWIPWKFKHVSLGYWNNLSNQRKFFDDLGLKLGVEKLEDWYQKLSADAISEHGGPGLLAQYKGSPIAALMAIYPEHTWIPWKFNNVPRSFWKDPSNIRKFFDDLGKQIGIQTLDDWYEKLSFEVIAEKGGAGIVTSNKGSPLKVLMIAYPEHNWIPWKFKNISRGIWNSSIHTRQFLSELSEKLSIQTLDDWYRVDWIQLKQFGASGLPRKHNGLYNLLKEQYPHHPWDPKKFKQGGKKGQRWLAVTLKKMFPDEGTISLSTC